MIPWLADDAPFPPLEQALGPESDAPGLLAASAEIQPERRIVADEDLGAHVNDAKRCQAAQSKGKRSAKNSHIIGLH